MIKIKSMDEAWRNAVVNREWRKPPGSVPHQAPLVKSNPKIAGGIFPKCSWGIVGYSVRLVITMKFPSRSLPPGQDAVVVIHRADPYVAVGIFIQTKYVVASDPISLFIDCLRPGAGYLLEAGQFGIA